MHLRMKRKIAVAIAVAATAGLACAGELIIFDSDNFSGNSMRITSQIDSLDPTGMNDRVESAIVRDGTWEVCRDANFRGGCLQLTPGRYPRLEPDFMRNISSAREIGEPRYSRTPVRGEGSAQAVLYQGSGFRGPAFPISRDVVRNLDRAGFNDRAGSLRVAEGYWLFCSDANFEGECRTFGPGDYPDLPPELDRRISSGRMISSAYPYGSAPNWQPR